MKDLDLNSQAYQNLVSIHASYSDLCSWVGNGVMFPSKKLYLTLDNSKVDGCKSIIVEDRHSIGDILKVVSNG